MLVLARPLHPHRPAELLGKDRGIRRRILMTIAAVAAGAFEIDEAHLVQRKTEEPGKGLLVSVRALRCGPYRGGLTAHVGDRARRPHRSMTLHRPVVCRAKRFRARRPLRGRSALVDQGFVHDAGLVPQGLDEIALRRKPGAFAPLGAQRPRCAHRAPFVVGDDCKQVFHANDLCAGNIPDRGFVDRRKLCADRRGTDHAGMQHVRHREVVHVDVRAEAFRRDIRPPQRFADDRVARGILQRRFGIELEIKLLAGNQVGKGNSGAAGFRPHHATGRFEILSLGVEPLRGKFDERFACGRRCLPDLHAAALDAV